MTEDTLFGLILFDPRSGETKQFYSAKINVNGNSKIMHIERIPLPNHIVPEKCRFVDYVGVEIGAMMQPTLSRMTLKSALSNRERKWLTRGWHCALGEVETAIFLGLIFTAITGWVSGNFGLSFRIVYIFYFCVAIYTIVLVYRVFLCIHVFKYFFSLKYSYMEPILIL
jgi:hypothetical protein